MIRLARKALAWADASATSPDPERPRCLNTLAPPYAVPSLSM